MADNTQYNAQATTGQSKHASPGEGQKQDTKMDKPDIQAFGRTSRHGDAIKAPENPEPASDVQINAHGTTGYSKHIGDVAADVGNGRLAGLLHQADHAMGVAVDMGLPNRPQDNVSPAQNVSDQQIAHIRNKLGEIRDALVNALDAEVQSKVPGVNLGNPADPTAQAIVDTARAMDQNHGRDDTNSFGITDRIAGLSTTMKNADTYLHDASSTPQREMTDALCTEIADRNIATVQQEDRITAEIENNNPETQGMRMD